MKYLKIIDYKDYRLFLADYYEKRKEADYRFSYRSFAAKADYSSAGFYLNVVQGKKNLTTAMTEKFIEAMGLDPHESEYFKLMIQYTHATSASVRDEIWMQMLKFHPAHVRRHNEHQREFYSSWLPAALHQALLVTNVSDKIDLLENQLHPKPKLSDLKKAFKLLKDLALISVNDQGYWKPVDLSVVGGLEVGAAVIHQFQRQMINLASNSLSELSKDERNIVTHTICTSKNGKKLIDLKIQNLQNEILEILKLEQGSEQVFQLNVQLFPLTRVHS